MSAFIYSLEHERIILELCNEFDILAVGCSEAIATTALQNASATQEVYLAGFDCIIVETAVVTQELRYMCAVSRVLRLPMVLLYPESASAEVVSFIESTELLSSIARMVYTNTSSLLERLSIFFE